MRVYKRKRLSENFEKKNPKESQNSSGMFSKIRLKMPARFIPSLITTGIHSFADSFKKYPNDSFKNHFPQKLLQNFGKRSLQKYH